jgi:signal transduction histidine kinase
VVALFRETSLPSNLRSRLFQLLGLGLLAGLMSIYIESLELPPVWVDIKQIQQVFFNIIINAIQAMPEGGLLTLTTDLVKLNGSDFVRVVIRDTGRGIASEVLEKTFTPFFTTKTQGTGLGLPICRQLIEYNNGSIEVESELDHGTTFSILLPAAALSGDPTGVKNSEPT